MFDATSRYAKLERATMTVADPDGTARTVTYVRRRFVPGAAGQTTLVEHTVTDGERPDTLTARYLGDPLQFWRVCDTNDVLRPDELTQTPGRVIEISMPNPTANS